MSITAPNTWFIVAALVASAIGCLPRSNIRLALISLWFLMPVFAAGFSAVFFPDRSSEVYVEPSAEFAGFVLIFLLPPWGLVTLLPFNMVRRMRELRNWE